MKRIRDIAGLGAAFAAWTVASASAAQTITDPTKPAAPAMPAKPADGPPSPFSFTVAYTADLLGAMSGGASSGGGYVDLVKLAAAYDGNIAGHEGFTGLVSVEHANGSDFTLRRVGGLQDVSSSEAQPEAFRLYEAWLQQSILNDQGGVKFGLIDINTTFDVQETAALFLNASHGIGPDLSDTGPNGPSDYPTPALGVAAFYRPAEGWTAQVAVFDGVAGDPAHRGDFVAVKLDGALVVGQIEKRFGDTARVEVGAWSYTGNYPSLDRFEPTGQPRKVAGDGGLYGLIEGRLTTKPGESDGGLSGWVRAGVANGEINDVENYLGAGLVYTGLIKGRDKDEIGIAVARAGLGSGARYVGALADRDIGAAETDLEATYRYAFKDWLNVQPDLQFVINPRGDVRIPNALIMGLRLALTYTK